MYGKRVDAREAFPLFSGVPAEFAPQISPFIDCRTKPRPRP